MAKKTEGVYIAKLERACITSTQRMPELTELVLGLEGVLEYIAGRLSPAMYRYLLQSPLFNRGTGRNRDKHTDKFGLQVAIDYNTLFRSDGRLVAVYGPIALIIAEGGEPIIRFTSSLSTQETALNTQRGAGDVRRYAHPLRDATIALNSYLRELTCCDSATVALGGILRRALRELGCNVCNLFSPDNRAKAAALLHKMFVDMLFPGHTGAAYYHLDFFIDEEFMQPEFHTESEISAPALVVRGVGVFPPRVDGCSPDTFADMVKGLRCPVREHILRGQLLQQEHTTVRVDHDAAVQANERQRSTKRQRMSLKSE